MPILFKIAESPLERESVLKLRHRVFVEQEGRFSHQTPYIVDLFDTFRETINILALKDGEAIGTIRVVLDNPVGLPAAEHYDFSACLNDVTGNCACFGWLCVLKEYRSYPGLLIGLFKMAVHEMRKDGAKHVIATIHPPLFRLLQRGFNARRVGDDFDSAGLGVPITPVFLSFDLIPPRSREVFDDYEEIILQDSSARRIYQEGEVITRRGTEGDEAFLILRGAVRALPVGENGEDIMPQPGQLNRLGEGDILFSKGDILGELSLLDCGARTATLVPYSSEVDVMVWSKDVFMRQLKDDEGKALDICRLLGKRLRKQILGKGEPADLRRFAAAGHVLFDASDEGAKSVDASWLARQCGIWPGTLVKITEEWRVQGIVAVEERNLRVLDSTALLRDAARRTSDIYQ